MLEDFALSYPAIRIRQKEGRDEHAVRRKARGLTRGLNERPSHRQSISAKSRSNNRPQGYSCVEPSANGSRLHSSNRRRSDTRRVGQQIRPSAKTAMSVRIACVYNVNWIQRVWKLSKMTVGIRETLRSLAGMR